jgi:hypothetical protein
LSAEAFAKVLAKAGSLAVMKKAVEGVRAVNAVLIVDAGNNRNSLCPL